MEHIGQKIKDLRKKADLTQDRLADYLGVSPQAVSKWEVGSASPDLALIAPLCRVFGCTADELLGIVPEEPQEERDFRERVERVLRQEWPGGIPARFDFAKAADYLKEWFRGDAWFGREVNDEAIRSTVSWLSEMDRDANLISDPRGWTSEYPDFERQMRERALAGDRDALDLLAAARTADLLSWPYYDKAFALCGLLGAVEIVDLASRAVPHAARLLPYPEARYTGITNDRGPLSPLRFNRLLRLLGSRIR